MKLNKPISTSFVGFSPNSIWPQWPHWKQRDGSSSDLTMADVASLEPQELVGGGDCKGDPLKMPQTFRFQKVDEMCLGIINSNSTND